MKGVINMMEYLLIGIIVNIIIVFTRFIRRKYKDLTFEGWEDPLFCIQLFALVLLVLTLSVLIWPVSIICEIREIIQERKGS
jgi:hypothetical protein